jgi:hypothetical protein
MKSNELGTFKGCFLYSIQLWAQLLVDTEIKLRKLNRCITISIDEMPDGNIVMSLYDFERRTFDVGNTGSGCISGIPFSGVDFIFEKVAKALLDYFDISY